MSEINSYEKRILITGVSGLVGRILFNYLFEKYPSKYYLLGLDQHLERSPRYALEHLQGWSEATTGPSIPSDRFVRCDITDGAQLNAIVLAHRIDTIIHLAAVLETDPQPEKILRVNVQGTKNVLHARALSSSRKRSTFHLSSPIVPSTVRRV